MVTSIDGTHHGKDSGITAQDTAVPLLLCASIILAWREHHGRRANWQGLTTTKTKALELAEQWERQPFVRRARRAQRHVLAAEAERVAAACIACDAHAQEAEVGGAHVPPVPGMRDGRRMGPGSVDGAAGGREWHTKGRGGGGALAGRSLTVGL